jgi:multisubunit Na+/H+ antiporter MnhG subunit
MSGNLRQETVISFILGDMKEGARLGLTGRGLFFSFVNFFRSFVQVHGYMFNMIRSDILFILPGIISVFIAALSLFRFPSKNKNIENPHFAYTLLMIILMQFIFAMFAAGNAEFMVMIPVLTFILVPLFTAKCEKFLTMILISIAFWNISYGLLPLHFRSPEPEQFLCDESFQRRDVIVIASDDQLLKNMLYYQTGNNNISNIYKSPSTLKIKGMEIKILEDIIDDALTAGETVYTDCIGSYAISRASIIEGDLNTDFFRKYETRPVRTWESTLGARSVYQIMK